MTGSSQCLRHMRTLAHCTHARWGPVIVQLARKTPLAQAGSHLFTLPPPHAGFPCRASGLPSPTASLLSQSCVDSSSVHQHGVGHIPQTGAVARAGILSSTLGLGPCPPLALGLKSAPPTRHRVAGREMCGFRRKWGFCYQEEGADIGECVSLCVCRAQGQGVLGWYPAFQTHHRSRISHTLVDVGWPLL